MFVCVHPCPCGWFSDPQKACGCAPAAVTKYQKRISGPLLDRIDIHIEVPRVDYEKLSGDRIGESSDCIRARIQAACDLQLKKWIIRYCLQRRHAHRGNPAVLQVTRGRSKFDAGGDIVLCMTQLNLSARAYHRTRSVKLARTIAELAGCEEIGSAQLAEALHLRSFEITDWVTKFRITFHLQFSLLTLISYFAIMLSLT
jgi:magnesium chelatase family protein